MRTTSASLRARDVMTPEPVCVDPTMTLAQLARVLRENEISGAPVVDRQGRVIGVVSKTDLVRRCTEGERDLPPAFLFEVLAEQSGEEDGVEITPEQVVCVEDFMTPEPETVSPETPLAAVASLMVSARIHRVVVVDGEMFPVGIITSLDLLDQLVRGGLSATDAT